MKKRILAASLMLICFTVFGQLSKSETIYDKNDNIISRNIRTNYEGKQDTSYICLFRNKKYQYVSDWFSFSIDKKRMITFLDTCYKLLKNYPVNTSISYEINDDLIMIENKKNYVFMVFDGGYFTLNYKELELMKSAMRKE
ncbi:MAG: hypothetical protein KatS3mg096_663 [Candidatus Parcubacteria bacterium]|nr:MAG: hypothetical protein KatS3mg096_663 [Candidatus Parcubacteria bacterium]